MTPRFLDSFAKTIGHEGKFTDNPRDDGNWTGGRQGSGILRGTQWGISAASYPKLDIRNLTLDMAREIYWTDYWLPCQCDQMPADADALVFDAAVNHGRGTAIRLLQAAIGVAQDGRFGPISQAALREAAKRPDRLEGRFVAHRILFWASLSRWPEFGRGWAIRGANELLAALEN